ncbi:hypothetical protein CEXT_65051 [Caerostris extrusa]|uniref:Uncharacterized protein n=1 Tax=Caerostris extrusa TaxID=172846 RepID=A0AAV4WH55_CAEEX|nr:hypothetical protein CEXT_65051 [Caerostris extrusa]
MPLVYSFSPPIQRVTNCSCGTPVEQVGDAPQCISTPTPLPSMCPFNPPPTFTASSSSFAIPSKTAVAVNRSRTGGAQWANQPPLPCRQQHIPRDWTRLRARVGSIRGKSERFVRFRWMTAATGGFTNRVFRAIRSFMKGPAHLGRCDQDSGEY